MDIVCSLRNNLLSHKTAIQITTNEPQSCVFCEGVKPSFTKYTLLHLIVRACDGTKKEADAFASASMERVTRLAADLPAENHMVSPPETAGSNSPPDWHAICQG